jgi:hypothetical protein
VTADELEAKIIAIKKRGLNIMVEQDLIRTLRAEYYKVKLNNKVREVSQTFRRNVGFLSRLCKDQATVNKINRYMGIALRPEDDYVLMEEKNLYSIYLAAAVAEYYGLPLDLLLFKDLSANEKLFREQYPALLKQNRD